MTGFELHTIPARVHGRYLVRRAPAGAANDAAPLLVGFHGYGETAEDHLAELVPIPGADAWTLVAVQALHPFYKRDGRVVASWMTRLDRELAIADNTAYAASVVDQLRAGASGARPPVVFAGFSQGVAMAYRAAAAVADAAGVIALAGDLPPEIDATALPPVLLGRGRDETWYDETKLADDLRRLGEAGVAAETCLFDGGHEWTDAFRAAAGAFLAERHHS